MVLTIHYTKIEGEHASFLTKILKSAKQPLPEETCPETESENVKHAIDLEHNAVNVYKKALEEVTSERVKEVFQALVEIEQDHEDLLKKKQE